MNWCDYATYARQSADELALDCEVQVFRAKGPGGQGVNTTDSAVRMTHVPTGITVTARETRSQFQNRQLCLQKIQRIIERRAQPPHLRKKTHVPQRLAGAPTRRQASSLTAEAHARPCRGRVVAGRVGTIHVLSNNMRIGNKVVYGPYRVW